MNSSYTNARRRQVVQLAGRASGTSWLADDIAEIALNKATAYIANHVHDTTVPDITIARFDLVENSIKRVV